MIRLMNDIHYLIYAFSKIWAIDKANDRIKTLRTLVEKAGAVNVDICCWDFLCTNVTDDKFNKVCLISPVGLI